jgi:hypothetical protein
MCPFALATGAILAVFGIDRATVFTKCPNRKLVVAVTIAIVLHVAVIWYWW